MTQVNLNLNQRHKYSIHWWAIRFTLLNEGQLWTKDLTIYKPFPSCLFPLFQNESWYTTFHMEISLIFKTMEVQEKLIFIWKVVHQDSFWNRGPRKLGNGLFYNDCFRKSNYLLEKLGEVVHIGGSKRLSIKAFQLKIDKRHISSQIQAEAIS